MAQALHNIPVIIMDGPCSHVNSSEGCDCSSKPSSLAQSLTEMDFERGIWQAALDGDVNRVKSLLDKGGDPDVRDGSGYTALVNNITVVANYTFFTLKSNCSK